MGYRQRERGVIHSELKQASKAVMKRPSGILGRLVECGYVATAFAIVIAALAEPGRVQAAIPDSGTGMIHACYHKNSGALRVIDAEAGKECLPSEMPLSWSEQPVGGGGPVAFARVTFDVMFDPETGDPIPVADVDEARSSNITDSMVKLVVFNLDPVRVNYCFDVPFAFKNIVMTPERPGNTMASAHLGVGVGCPAGTDFFVQLVNSILLEPMEGDFYILIH